MKSLKNKTIVIDGNWYAPEKHFRSYKSVEKCDLFDTTSSAGDWSGYIIQRVSKSRIDLLLWTQENDGGGGFLVNTSLVCSFFNQLPTEEEIFEVFKELYYR
jgi:hypothetical protein